VTRRASVVAGPKRGITLIAFAVGLLLGPMTQAASAHGEVVRAAPGPCDIAGSSPAVVLEFSEELDAARSSAQLVGPGGATVATGHVDLDDLDRSTINVGPVASLDPGRYEVRFDVLSAIDGDVTTGSYEFAVGTEAAADPFAQDCELVDSEAAKSSTTPNTLLMLVGVAGVLVVGLGVNHLSSKADSVEV
jgi:copper resistance protein C